jgi:aldehyde dehydrogenase (NAD+)
MRPLTNGREIIMQHTTDALRALGLRDINPGTWSGSQGWSKQTAGAIIDSINPSTGQRLAQVRGATPEDYEDVMAAAVAAAAAWRRVPAPKRGEAVRLMGEELRQYKDALGSLVSLENGKIKAEGVGEVQEMIDIADFAVGQSRMLYGLTMHSERPQHRM